MLTSLPPAKDFPEPGKKPGFGPWFGISASKAKAFSDCPRAWWLNTNQGWQGWANKYGPAPDPASKLAYVLGKLESLYGLAGQVAGETVYAWLEGRIPRESMLEAGLALFDRRVAQGKANSAGPCEVDPKGSPGLEEYYYQTNEHHLAARLKKARKMCEDALLGAEGSKYLAAMKEGRMGRVQCEDGTLETFWLDDVQTWVIPDILCQNGTLRIIDLKAGRPRPEHRLQVQIYAIWAAKFGKPVKAFLVYLAHGERVEVDCSPAALATAKAEMLAAAAEIQGRLVDPRCNLGAKEDFPQNLGACKTCKFFESCHGSRERK